jgi:hypothetical protein
MLRLIQLSGVYAGCHFFIPMPSVVMLSDVMLNVMAPDKKNEFLKEKISNPGKGGFFCKGRKIFQVVDYTTKTIISNRLEGKGSLQLGRPQWSVFRKRCAKQNFNPN